MPLLDNRSSCMRHRLRCCFLILVGLLLATVIVPKSYRRVLTIVVTTIFCLLVIPRSKAKIESFSPSSTVTYDSVLELQHATTLALQISSAKCFLVSTPTTYWKSGSSGNFEVNAGPNQHWQSMWQIRRAYGYLAGGNLKDNTSESDAVADGDIIRLQDLWSGRFLHSQSTKADYPSGSFNEVSTSKTPSLDDNWKLFISGGGQLSSISDFKLQHVTTGAWLHSMNAQILLYPNQNVASQIVVTSPTASADSVWHIYRAESSANRAVRMYTDLNNAESAMDTYLPIGSLQQELVLNDSRDSVTEKLILGIIIPPGVIVDFYRGTNKTTLVTRLSSGKYDNLSLGTIATTVVRPYCSISMWANCNFTGQSACLSFGYSKLPFFPQSWQISDGVVVKLFNANTQLAIQPSSNSATMSPAAIGPCSSGNMTLGTTTNASFDSCTQTCLSDPACVAAETVGANTCNLYVSGTRPVPTLPISSSSANNSPFLGLWDSGLNVIQFGTSLSGVWTGSSSSRPAVIVTPTGSNTATFKFPDDASYTATVNGTKVTFSNNSTWNLVTPVKPVTSQTNTTSNCSLKMPTFSNEVVCSSTTNPSFSQITEVVAFPIGANISLFRDPIADPNSKATFDTPAATNALPAIAKQYLQCYLDSCLPESYVSGRIWKDVSGNNRHFVWKTSPRFTRADGTFKSIDQVGLVAEGPPSNHFALRDGSRGYTIALVLSAYKQQTSNSFTISFSDSKENPQGLSCTIPSAEGEVCLDNTTATGNRATIKSTAFNPFQWNTIVLRRSIDDKLSIWVNGDKMTESTTSSLAPLALGVSNVKLFGGHCGGARAFALYNAALTDSDVVSLTNFLETTHRTYKAALGQGTSAHIKQVLPDLKISAGLMCLLDARNSSSASPSSKAWLDLTNNHNDFTWIGMPVLKAGRFIKLNTNGTGLRGPPSDSFGISSAYTIFVASRTNTLSTSPAFHLSSSIQQDLALTTTSKDGKMIATHGTASASCPTTWQQYCVYAYRWSNTKAGGSVISLFIDGWKQTDTIVPSSGTPIFDGTMAEIGGGVSKGIDWCADVGALAIYNRSLGDQEIKVMADYLNAALYGSSSGPSATSALPNTSKATSGVCKNQTVGAAYYSKSQCLSPKANTDGTFDAVEPATGGWCFTSSTDPSVRGFCGQRTTYPIDTAIDKTTPVMSYTSARQFCEAKGGRLCNADEICNQGPGGRPTVGFETLSKADCLTVGGVYDDKNQVCRAPDGTSPYYVPGQESYLPVNDYNNAWMTIGSADPGKMCRTFDDVTGSTPSWGQSTTPATGRQNIMCCATGASGLSECDLMKQKLDTIQEQLNNNPDPATQVGLLNSQKTLQIQYQQNCSFLPYQTAYDAYQTAQKQASTVSANVMSAERDVEAQKAAVISLSGVIDASGKQFPDSDAATASKATPFPDGTFHAIGQVSDIKNQMSAVQNDIDAQKARLQACPGNPSCPADKKNVKSPLPDAGKCNTSDLVTSVLRQPVVAQDPVMGNRLRLALQPRNILQGTDIRKHRDYYKYVNAKNVKACTSLPKDTGKTPKDFDINKYPGFADNYVPLQSLDIAQVPPDRLNDYNMLRQQ